MSSNSSLSTENQTNFSTVVGNQTANQSSRSITLKDLNDIQARIYYGADILFGSLMIPGIIGNLHVLHIYFYKKPKNNTRVYVLFLAMIDLMSCGLVYPFNIANCLLPYMFYDNVSCKIFLFLNAFATFGSAVALLVIAIERYRKICTPFKTQITIKYAKLSCVFVILITALYSIPILFLFGSTRIPTFEPGYYGYECHYITELRNTLFHELYSGATLLLTVFMSICMIILYFVIGLHLWKQNKKMNRKKTSKKMDKARNAAMALIREKVGEVEESQTDSNITETTSTTTDHDISAKLSSNDINRATYLNKAFEGSENSHHEKVINYDHLDAVRIILTNNKTGDKLDTITEINEQVDEIKSTNQKTGNISKPIHRMDVEQGKKGPTNQQDEDKKGKEVLPNQETDSKSDKTKTKVKTIKKLDKADQMRRTSYMFFLITLCFLVSYISHPFLRLYQVLNMDWYASLALPNLITFHTALVTLYVNNTVNSFIYTLCDSHYRQEIKTFYAKLFYCTKKG